MQIFTLAMKRVGILIFFILIGAILYVNSLRNDFHYDDNHHILGNSYIRTMGNIPYFFTQPRSFSVRSTLHRHYRPLVMTSYAINYYLGGLARPGYHLTNLGFHIGSAFLIFLILQAMLGRSKISFIPLAAGLIFLTTPYNTEVVNYIAARSTVMCTFFYLLAFYFWVRFKTRLKTPPPFPPPRGGRVREGVGFYIASLLAFILAMLTKEIAITLPVMLLLYDIYFVYDRVGVNFAHSRDKLQLAPTSTFIKRGLSYLPFAIVGGFVGVLSRIIFFRRFIQEKDIDPITHLIVEIKVIAKYFYHMAIPLNLSVEHTVRGTPDIYLLISFILIIVLLALIYLLWRRLDPLWHTGSFFIAWFFITLLPTTFIALNYPYQENRGYMSAVGFVALLAVGLDRVRKKIVTSENPFCSPSPFSPILGYSLIGLLVIAYSIGVVQRNQVWLNDETLWSDVLKKYPESPTAHRAIGNYYVLQRQLEKAEEEYQAALKISPDDPSILTNIGALYSMKGETEKAEEIFRRALDINPFGDTVNFHMAKLLYTRGDLQPAAKHLLRTMIIRPDSLDVAVKLIDVYDRMEKLDEAYDRLSAGIKDDPDNPAIRRALGIIYMKRGQWREASMEFEVVLSYMPNDPLTLIDSGIVYLRQGMMELAEKRFSQALLISPTNNTALQSMGIFYQKEGRYDEALSMYKKALESNPKSYTILNNMALIYFEKKEYENAFNALQMALQIAPSYHMGRVNLAKIYETQGKTGIARKEYQRVLKEVSPEGGDKEVYMKAKEGLAALRQ